MYPSLEEKKIDTWTLYSFIKLTSQLDLKVIKGTLHILSQVKDKRKYRLMAESVCCLVQKYG